MRRELLQKGYFPPPVPPIFSSKTFAEFADANPAAFQTPSKDVRGVDYSASQSGFRRRRFLIPSPHAQFNIADFISNNWISIAAHYSQSKYSLSTPRWAAAGESRSIKITSFKKLHYLVHEKLGSYPFIAKSDVRRYFPSIYTHSIPWAVHGKLASKADRNPNSNVVAFNLLDLFIRKGQDGQTIGIPIGPDTSRVISEIIGCAMDKEIKARAGTNHAACIRHVDDIYMAAETREKAENCIAALRASLRDFELEINEVKTAVYESASFLEDTWPKKVRRLIAEYRRSRSELHLFSMFEETFELAKTEGTDAPVRYLLRGADKILSFSFGKWEILENFLLKILNYYPNAIDYVSLIAIWRKLRSNDLSNAKWTKALNERIQYHLKMGHDHEIAWLIFLAVSCNWKIGAIPSKQIAQYPNAACAILGLYARRSKILSDKAPLDFWKKNATPENFETEWWLFAYEAYRRNWLGSGWRSVAAQTPFSRMKQAGVTFCRFGEPIKSIVGYRAQQFGSHAIQTDETEYDEFDDFDDGNVGEWGGEPADDDDDGDHIAAEEDLL
jgi:hypothetical protein